VNKDKIIDALRQNSTNTFEDVRVDQNGIPVKLLFSKEQTEMGFGIRHNSVQKMVYGTGISASDLDRLTYAN